MSPEDTSQPTKVCPTCGTRLSENASRCLVCGRSFAAAPAGVGPGAAQAAVVQSPRMPEVTLSLPVAIGLFILVLGIGAAVVYFLLNGKTPAAAVSDAGTPTPTVTFTPTLSMTPTDTLEPTATPTVTPLPPIEYVIQSNDFCDTIAWTYGVTVQSILQANPGMRCELLSPGTTILIPQPTPTPPPAPTPTLSPAEATIAACETITYRVEPGDSLQAIAANYNVTMESIRKYNGLVDDTVFAGRDLIIPLCERKPTPGPTATPTNPPPYNPPNLLLPADGAAFTAANDSVTLQWASVGTLRSNEYYQVTIEDITEGQGRKLVDYVTDTKYIVPASFRPTDTIPHVLRWFVVPVRQTSSTTSAGQPVYEPAGEASAWRVFTWWIAGSPGQQSNTETQPPATAETPSP
jgi:LysM repeat protein